MIFTLFLISVNLLSLFINTSECAKLLAVYPTAAFSHQVFFRPLTLELVKRGHHVTVITTDPMFAKGQSPKNLREIDVSFSYTMKQSFLNATKGQADDYFSQSRALLDFLKNIVEAQLMSDDVKELINTEKHFDLLIVEAYYRMFWALGHIYKAPTILINSMGGGSDTYSALGVPMHTFLYPLYYCKRIYNLKFWEKVQRLYMEQRIADLYYGSEEAENMAVKKILPQATNFSELLKEVDAFMPNDYHIWENNRPVPPGVIYVGGLYQPAAENLPEDLQLYLDNSKRGVIYFSLGTNIKPSLFSLEKKLILLTVLSQLPYDVLLKWDEDTIPVPAKNIKIAKWFPQPGVLRHKNIKLFITQCGKQSTSDAIYAGVPLIGMPMIIDQWQTAEKMVHYGAAVQIDMVSVTEKEFKDAIETIIGNDSYRHNIIKLRSLMMDQPQSALERAVWWTEHVLRHGGGKHLRAPTANLSWAQYYDIELIFIVLSVIFGTTSLVGILAYWSVKKMLRKLNVGVDARKII